METISLTPEWNHWVSLEVSSKVQQLFFGRPLYHSPSHLLIPASSEGVTKISSNTSDYPLELSTYDDGSQDGSRSRLRQHGRP